ncbi:MAG: class I SAM-dependent methyltransferase [Acidimicrobiales bacterium]
MGAQDNGEIAFWNAAASNYDSLSRHGIRSAQELDAWRSALAEHLGSAQLAVLDVGTGTGSLALLAAELGHNLVAVDLSEPMLNEARSKATALRRTVDFRQDDLTTLLTVEDGTLDIIMSRHVLWTLTDPLRTIQLWKRKLRPGGRLLAIDGCWSAGGWPSRLLRRIGLSLARIQGAPHEHGASYYDQLATGSLPFRRISTYEPVTAVFQEAGLTGVGGKWLTAVDIAEREAMSVAERWIEQGRRFSVWGDKPLDNATATRDERPSHGQFT